MFILPYDDALIASKSNLTEYILNRENYGRINYKDKQNPKDSWTFPFVTGHKYKIHWSATGVDFTNMNLGMSEKWQETDKNVILFANYTDVRAIMDVKIGG